MSQNTMESRFNPTFGFSNNNSNAAQRRRNAIDKAQREADAENESINNIMARRRNRMDKISRGEVISSPMRNDNDLDIVDRSELLGTQSTNSNSNSSSNLDGLNNNNFMDLFDESYYLDNSRKSKKAVSEDVAMMNANGGINEVMNDNRKLSRSELLKKKALDLETLVVDRLTRDKLNDANRVFKVLEKMHQKYSDDIVSDIYYRVLQSMPKETNNQSAVYSYRSNKNNFKNVLNELNTKNNIKAYNEDNNCINSLGNMFEECDLNICSDKCKENIMKAKEESEKDECKKLITGHQDGNDLKMQDDIKSTILERLKYCKKIADMEKGNFDMVTYSDKLELKNKIIAEIQKMSRLANMHYNSCNSKASKFFEEDTKFKSILNLIKTIDYTKLSLERLQEIRNDLTTLPTCDMLKFKDHDAQRDDDVKEGIRVGKYIIPNKTDYYEQIKGKDKPFVYRDIATDSHYLYDSFSKTLTPFEYPMSQDSLENQMEIDAKYDKRELAAKNLGPAEYQEMYNINFDSLNSKGPIMSPAPAPNDILEEVYSPSPAENNADNNLNKEINKLVTESEKTVFFNLTAKNVIEYAGLIILVLVVLSIFASI